MNPAHIKSVDEVVADLRAKGELDKGTLERFRKKIRAKKIATGFVSCVAAIVSISLFIKFNFTDIIIAIIIGAGGYFALFFYNDNKEKKLLVLFSCGKISNGIVTNHELRKRFRLPSVALINISYILDNAKTYKATIEESDVEEFYYEIVKIKIGDKVQVIYLENAPEECWIYTEKLNNTYNIRKNRMV